MAQSGHPLASQEGNRPGYSTFGKLQNTIIHK